jgi:hypothetical protein
MRLTIPSMKRKGRLDITVTADIETSPETERNTIERVMIEANAVIEKSEIGMTDEKVTKVVKLLIIYLFNIIILIDYRRLL